MLKQPRQTIHANVRNLDMCQIVRLRLVGSSSAEASQIDQPAGAGSRSVGVQPSGSGSSTVRSTIHASALNEESRIWAAERPSGPNSRSAQENDGGPSSNRTPDGGAPGCRPGAR